MTTASRRREKLSDAPATVLAVSSEDIRLRGYANLHDVLRDLPGMEAIENYFSEVGTLVPVRGVVGNNKIIVLVNGMRVNPLDAGAAFSQQWRAVGLSGYAQYLHSDRTDLSRQYPAWWQLNQNVAQPKGSGTPPKRWEDGFNGFFRLYGRARVHARGRLAGPDERDRGQETA